MNEHTKGPWNTGICISDGVFEIRAPGGAALAVICGRHAHDRKNPITPELAAANARLIAAAPEMYALLREIDQYGTVTRDLQGKLDELLKSIEGK